MPDQNDSLISLIAGVIGDSHRPLEIVTDHPRSQQKDRIHFSLTDMIGSNPRPSPIYWNFNDKY